MIKNMLLELAQNDGLCPKRKTPNEYAGACPHCGGKDRFIIFAEKDKYWYRQCRKSGDAIQYLREFHGISYPFAALQVGKDILPSSGRAVVVPAPKAPALKVETSAAWAATAGQFIEWAHRKLMENTKVLNRLLMERVFARKTAKLFKLGWSAQNVYHLKKDCGLPANDKKLFIPSSLVIPWQDKRIRIRATNCTCGALSPEDRDLLSHMVFGRCERTLDALDTVAAN